MVGDGLADAEQKREVLCVSSDAVGVGPVGSMPM